MSKPIHLRLPPIPVHVLRTLTRETMHRGSNTGWTPGYPCPAGDRGFLPVNEITMLWLQAQGWLRLRHGVARITTEGREVVGLIDRDEWGEAA